MSHEADVAIHSSRGVIRLGGFMGDDLSKTSSRDRRMVDLSEVWERRYWANAFQVSEVELMEAIAAVGPYEENLRKYFRAPPKVAY
jgi:hypothetical protein